VNLNGDPSGDEWNFGADFVVHLKPDTSLGVTEAEFPQRIRLRQNYPNPFNPVTHLSYELDRPSYVLGREVADLVDERKEPGTYTASWDGGTNPGGVYFYRLLAAPTSSGRSNGGVVETETGKMTLLR
jgi:hypothetical protein